MEEKIHAKAIVDVARDGGVLEVLLPGNWEEANDLHGRRKGLPRGPGSRGILYLRYGLKTIFKNFPNTLREPSTD